MDERSQFSNEVLEQFGFLRILGYEVDEILPTIVRFRSADSKINIFHGRRSREIGLEIEPTASDEYYSISQLLRLIDPSREKAYRSFAAFDPAVIEQGVSELAATFKSIVDSDLLSDPNLWKKLKIQRQEWLESYALESKLKSARTKSEKAWKAGDYESFVDALGGFTNKLSKAEIAKLTYAKKKLSTK